MTHSTKKCRGRVQSKIALDPTKLAKSITQSIWMQRKWLNSIRVCKIFTLCMSGDWQGRALWAVGGGKCATTPHIISLGKHKRTMRREEITHNETKWHENLDYEHNKINMVLSPKSNLDFPSSFCLHIIAYIPKLPSYHVLIFKAKKINNYIACEIYEYWYSYPDFGMRSFAGLCIWLVLHEWPYMPFWTALILVGMTLQTYVQIHAAFW